jgi:hypothetical protein
MEKRGYGQKILNTTIDNNSSGFCSSHDIEAISMTEIHFI